VTSSDPRTLIAAAASLLGAVAAATRLPTRSAVRTDPLLMIPRESRRER